MDNAKCPTCGADTYRAFVQVFGSGGDGTPIPSSRDTALFCDEHGQIRGTLKSN